MKHFILLTSANSHKTTTKYCNYVNIRINLHFCFSATEEGNVVSPLHDIPLYANEEKTTYNMLVEVPRWTNAKMEVGK